METRWNFRARLLQFTRVLQYRGNVNRFWLRLYDLSRDSADMILQTLKAFRQLFVASLNLKYENFDINGAGISMTSFKNVEDSKVWTSKTRDSTRSKFHGYAVFKLVISCIKIEGWLGAKSRDSVSSKFWSYVISNEVFFLYCRNKKLV